jgi:sodium/hydrogen antiporter
LPASSPAIPLPGSK